MNYEYDCGEDYVFQAEPDEHVETPRRTSLGLNMAYFEREASLSYGLVCACQRCGNLTRTLVHEIGDEHYCRFCGRKMVVTRYALSDDEAFLLFYDTEEAREFQNNVFAEYIRDNPHFNARSQSKRYELLRTKYKE